MTGVTVCQKKCVKKEMPRQITSWGGAGKPKTQTQCDGQWEATAKGICLDSKTKLQQPSARISMVGSQRRIGRGARGAANNYRGGAGGGNLGHPLQGLLLRWVELDGGAAVGRDGQHLEGGAAAPL